MERDEGGKTMPTAEVDAPEVEEQIRQRAQELFLARAASGAEGDALSDWLAAEAEIRGLGAEGR